MSETLQPGIPVIIHQVAQQTLEQVEQLFHVCLQFVQRGVAIDGTGSEELSNTVFDYASANVATAFKFVQRLVLLKDAQQLASLQNEFVQAQMQATAEQSKALSEIAAKAIYARQKFQ